MSFCIHEDTCMETKMCKYGVGRRVCCIFSGWKCRVTSYSENTTLVWEVYVKYYNSTYAVHFWYLWCVCISSTMVGPNVEVVFLTNISFNIPKIRQTLRMSHIRTSWISVITLYLRGHCEQLMALKVIFLSGLWQNTFRWFTICDFSFSFVNFVFWALYHGLGPI